VAVERGLEECLFECILCLGLLVRVVVSPFREGGGASAVRGVVTAGEALGLLDPLMRKI
jgi:hypothetical protein